MFGHVHSIKEKLYGLFNLYVQLDVTICDELIEIKKSEISGLHELKNRLISDVVTGNIDVRDIEIPEYEFTDESADSDLGDVDFDVDEEQED